MRAWTGSLVVLAMVAGLTCPASAGVQYVFSGNITVNGPTQLFVYDSPNFVRSEIALFPSELTAAENVALATFHPSAPPDKQDPMASDLISINFNGAQYDYYFALGAFGAFDNYDTVLSTFPNGSLIVETISLPSPVPGVSTLALLGWGVPALLLLMHRQGRCHRAAHGPRKGGPPKRT
jgi:hypothetical protein